MPKTHRFLRNLLVVGMFLCRLSQTDSRTIGTVSIFGDDPGYVACGGSCVSSANVTESFHLVTIKSALLYVDATFSSAGSLKGCRRDMLSQMRILCDKKPSCEIPIPSSLSFFPAEIDSAGTVNVSRLNLPPSYCRTLVNRQKILDVTYMCNKGRTL
ncbi:hypothetical protein RvY_00952 [Ramazzottius varieornatus]|uniref:SUEL-type lectin domain-containing protein n=1 Tax=Ramazzottius varieornatus TaxID=947166 RepID=A0A1D1UFI9_RAMVA|nr:hypothetical protein RvY_00952 [Ramazzottius varieornatus]